jgi:hypothetical protein
MAGSLTDVELNWIRVDQEAELDSSGIIYRITDPGTISKVTGLFTGPTSVTIYSGLLSVGPIVSRRDRFDVHGEQQIYQNQYRVLLPYDADGIHIGDFLQVTTSEDPDFVTKEMEIKDVLLVSDISLRRLTAIDISE